MNLHKTSYAKYILLKRNNGASWVYVVGNAFIPSVFVIVLPHTLQHGMVQQFSRNALLLKYDVDIIFVVIACKEEV